VIYSAGCLAVTVVTIKRWYYFNVCDLVHNKEDGLMGNHSHSVFPLYGYLIFIARSMALCWSCTCLSAVSVFIESTVCTIDMNLLTSHKTWAWLCGSKTLKLGTVYQLLHWSVIYFSMVKLLHNWPSKFCCSLTNQSIQPLLQESSPGSRSRYNIFFFWILTAYFFRVCFNIILPSAPEFPKQ